MRNSRKTNKRDLNEDDKSEKKLDKIITLLQQLIALQLAANGASQEAIGKNIQVAKSTVVKMLSGVKKGSDKK